jgi:hypothetical protein
MNRNTLFVFLSLVALVMLLPVCGGVNIHSVNNQQIAAVVTPVVPPATSFDGNGTPPPPFPNFAADGNGTPPPPFPNLGFDGNGTPPPPFPNLALDGNGTPPPPFPNAWGIPRVS